jgi:hypothetical protein
MGEQSPTPSTRDPGGKPTPTRHFTKRAKRTGFFVFVDNDEKMKNDTTMNESTKDCQEMKR